MRPSRFPFRESAWPASRLVSAAPSSLFCVTCFLRNASTIATASAMKFEAEDELSPEIAPIELTRLPVRSPKMPGNSEPPSFSSASVFSPPPRKLPRLPTMPGSSPGVLSRLISVAAPDAVEPFCMRPPSSAGSAASTADCVVDSDAPRNLPAWPTSCGPMALDIISSRLIAMNDLLCGTGKFAVFHPARWPTPWGPRPWRSLPAQPLCAGSEAPYARGGFASAQRPEQEVLRIVPALFADVVGHHRHELVDLILAQAQPRQGRVESARGDLACPKPIGRR